ncbi:cation diffusion facilitator family transporter [Roseivirga sp. BDSF3-8]|uniref:cation diffusion facilitator family transporter n=1 Tax=Roseivirga sp. BDSF3-8 TaxID=3241598 RepID=UPI003531FDC5
MGHHHHHNHDAPIKNIRIAFFLNIGFTILEIIGGFYTNSMAILSDALHDLGDSLSLGIAWYFQKVSTKGRDSKFSYGYRRFSLLGAIVNGLVLVAGSVFILSEAIPRLLNPQMPETTGMIILSVFGILVNGFAVHRLQQGHSHNEEMLSLHLLEDVLGWAAVLIASIVMKFVDWPWLDPLLSILISFWLLYNVYKNLRKSLRIILQAIPHGLDIGMVQNELEGLQGVREVHDMHIWSLDGEYHVLTAHMVVREEMSAGERITLKETARKLIKDKGIDHSTLELESPEEDCHLQDC